MLAGPVRAVRQPSLAQRAQLPQRRPYSPLLGSKRLDLQDATLKTVCDGSDTGPLAKHS